MLARPILPSFANANEMERQMVIKVKHGDTLKRMGAYVHGQLMDLNMSKLRSKIISLFKISNDAELILMYTDEDGDIVTLDDDDELRDAVIGQRLNPLRITVQLKYPDSADARPERSTPSCSVNAPWPVIRPIVDEQENTSPMLANKSAAHHQPQMFQQQQQQQQQQPMQRNAMMGVTAGTGHMGNDGMVSLGGLGHSSGMGGLRTMSGLTSLRPNQMNLSHMSNFGNGIRPSSSSPDQAILMAQKLRQVQQNRVAAGISGMYGGQSGMAGCIPSPASLSMLGNAMNGVNMSQLQQNVPASMGQSKISAPSSYTHLHRMQLQQMQLQQQQLQLQQQQQQQLQQQQISSPLQQGSPSIMIQQQQQQQQMSQPTAMRPQLSSGALQHQTNKNIGCFAETNFSGTNDFSGTNEECVEQVVEGGHVEQPAQVAGCLMDAGEDDLSRPTPVAAAAAPAVSYPLSDAYRPIAFAAVDSDGNHVEQTLLKELEGMGFKQIELNKEILRLNEYDREQSVDDICGFPEWDPLLLELKEMGFNDEELNKKLLVKKGGSIKRTVLDLIAGKVSE